MILINISKQFSKFPAGRVISDGPYSGEKFREDLLVPALKLDGKVEIHLDGTRGYGSSFLEEAFGGLIRVHGYSANDLLKRLTFISTRPTYVQEIKQYIKDAGNVSR